MKTPEQIVLNGRFTLDGLRAIVAAREKRLGLPDPRQQAAAQCAKIIRGACAFEDWLDMGIGVAEQIEREFGIAKAADTLPTSTGPTHQVCIKAHETTVGNTVPIGHVVTGGLMQQPACWLPCDEYGWITHVPTADSVCPVPPGLEIELMTQQTPTYRYVCRVPAGRMWQVKWDEDSTVVAWRIPLNF